MKKIIVTSSIALLGLAATFVACNKHDETSKTESTEHKLVGKPGVVNV